MNDDARRADNRDRLGAIAAPRQSAIPEAMRHSIDPSRITIVKAGDFAKAGVAPSK